MSIRITDLPLETVLENDDTIVLVKDGKVRQTRVKDVNTQKIKAINSNYSLQEMDGLILCDASTGQIEIQLRSAASSVGKEYGFRKTDSSSNIIRLICDGSDLINSESSGVVLLTKNDTYYIIGTETGWIVNFETILANSSASGLIVLKDELDSEIINRILDVDAEELRAITVENSLSGSIVALNDSVSGEVLRATIAEGLLSNRLDIVEGSNTTSGSILFAVKQESDRAIVAENLLDSRLDIVEGENTTSGSIAFAVKQETDRAISAENSLDARLDVIEGGSGTVGSVSYLIKQETDRAVAVENALDSRLDIVEGSNTTSGSIAFAVKQESDRAISAENALEARLDIVEGSNATSGSIAYAVKQETDRAIAIENSLDSRLDILEGSNTTSGSVAFSVKEETDRAVSAENLLDSRLDIIEGSNTTTGSIAYAVKLETDRAIAAENSLDSRLDVVEGSNTTSGSIAFAIKQESDRAISVENSLDSRLDILEGSNATSGSVAYAVKIETDRAIAQETAIRNEFASGDVATLASGKLYTDNSIAALINSAPSMLDTLGEIAIAIQNDQSVTSGILTSISNEVTRATNAENALDSRLDIVEGSSATSGSIAYAVKQEQDRAIAAENSLDSRLDIIEGSNTTSGSIAFSVKQEADRAIAVENSLSGSITSINQSISELSGRNTYLIKPSDSSSSSTGYIDISGMSASLLANSIYKIEAQVIFQLSTNAEGINILEVGPSNSVINANWSIASQSVGYISDLATIGFPSLVKNVNINAIATIWISTTSSGTFNLQFASDTSGSAVTVKSGSALHIQKLV